MDPTTPYARFVTRILPTENQICVLRGYFRRGLSVPSSVESVILKNWLNYAIRGKMGDVVDYLDKLPTIIKAPSGQNTVSGRAAADLE